MQKVEGSRLKALEHRNLKAIFKRVSGGLGGPTHVLAGLVRLGNEQVLPDI